MICRPAFFRSTVQRQGELGEKLKVLPSFHRFWKEAGFDVEKLRPTATGESEVLGSEKLAIGMKADALHATLCVMQLPADVKRGKDLKDCFAQWQSELQRAADALLPFTVNCFFEKSWGTETDPPADLLVKAVQEDGREETKSGDLKVAAEVRKILKAKCVQLKEGSHAHEHPFHMSVRKHVVADIKNMDAYPSLSLSFDKIAITPLAVDKARKYPCGWAGMFHSQARHSAS